MTYVESKDGLIGDFLGQVPTLQALAKQDRLVVQIHPEARKLLPIIDNTDGIIFSDVAAGQISHTLHSATAFSIATAKNLYMSQAFFEQAGLPIPEVAPKAKLKPVPAARRWDYAISPFARSLPKRQLLEADIWQQLVDQMPDKKFALLGTMKHDDWKFIQGPNVEPIFDFPFTDVCATLKGLTHGLISVVTGTSHLAFHLGVKNWILNNQDFAWGTNPDGHSLRHYIPALFVENIIEFLESNK